MGRATKWLRSLIGGGKKANKETSKEYYYSNSSSNNGSVEDRREKKRWSFTKSGRDKDTRDLPNPTTADAAWLRSLYAETEKEQTKHAIAVAAATAAAADAAVAAAQAAVAVVRLTSHGRGSVFGAVHERTAAVKIQTAFRGYLAKKALRALKALVKLQALVRGYLVRKQAAATLRSMQSLIRAQTTVRAQKSRNVPSIPSRSVLHDERFDESSSFHGRRMYLDNVNSGGYDQSPKIVEIDTCRPKSRLSQRPASPSPADDEMPMSSPLPARINISDCRNDFADYYDWCGNKNCRISATAQSTPRYANLTMPLTPAKSVCGGGGGGENFRLLHCPNYMAKTQSFEAKVRSQSAPKQRPEPGCPASPAACARKRIPLSEMVESRASLSCVGVRRSCSEAFNFKAAVVGRLDRSSELEKGYYIHRKW